MHEMVFMPVAEPDHLHIFFGAKTDQSFTIRCRIDQNACAFDIKRVAEGIAPLIFSGNKTDRTKRTFFHRMIFPSPRRQAQSEGAEWSQTSEITF